MCLFVGKLIISESWSDTNSGMRLSDLCHVQVHTVEISNNAWRKFDGHHVWRPSKENVMHFTFFYEAKLVGETAIGDDYPSVWEGSDNLSRINSINLIKLEQTTYTLLHLITSEGFLTRSTLGARISWLILTPYAPNLLPNDLFPVPQDQGDEIKSLRMSKWSTSPWSSYCFILSRQESNLAYWWWRCRFSINWGD